MRPNTQTTQSTHPFRPHHEPASTPVAATSTLLIPTLSQSTRYPQYSHESSLKDTLKSLTGLISLLRSGNAASLEPLLDLCARLKESKDLLIQAQFVADAGPELNQLRQAMPSLFKKLADCLDRHQDVRLSIDSLHTLCLGLGVLAPPVAKPLLTPAQCRAAQAVITRLSTALAGQLVAHFEHQVLDAGTLLNCLNWFSRALKAELLPQQTPAATTLFQAALCQFQQWSESSHSTCLNSRQLAKAMVQLNAMVSKRLINLDTATPAGRANRAAWADCVHKLCQQFLSNDQWLNGCHGVELINVTNTLKDGLELGLIDGTDAHFQTAFTLLSRRINQQAFTGSSSLTTLSNSANFLRCLFEHGLLGDRASDSGQAVLHLPDQINRLAQCDDLNDHHVQALVNLTSFLKATDRWLALQPPSASQTAWATLAQASQSLVAVVHQVSASDPQWMQTPRTSTALLSALQHLAQRGLLSVRDSEPLQILLLQLLEAIPQWQVKPHDSLTLLQSLRALVALHQRPLESAPLQAVPAFGPALAHLLQQLQQHLPTQFSNDERLACLQAVQTGAALGTVSVEDCQPLLQQLLKTTTPVDLARLAQAIRESGLLTETVEPLTESALQAPIAAASPPATQQAKTRGATYRADIAQPTSSSAVTVASPPTAGRTNTDQWIAPRHVVKPGQITSAASRIKPTIVTADTFTAPMLSPRPSAQPTLNAANHQQDENPITVEPKAAKSSAKSSEKSSAESPPSASKQSGVTWQKAQKEWFDLLSSGSPKALSRLQELAALHPDLINQKPPGKKGQSALFLALTQGRKDIVAWLLEHDRHSSNIDLGKLLLEILNQVAPIKKSHVAVLRLLIESLVKNHDQTISDKHTQAMPGAQPLSKKELYSHRAALLSDEHKKLLGQFSEISGILEELKLLPAKQSTKITTLPVTTSPALPAARKGNRTDVALIPKEGVSANEIKFTLTDLKETKLMLAVGLGDYNLIKQTLATASNVDALLRAQNGIGMTALAQAARLGRTAIVKMLLEASGNKTALAQIADDDGWNAVMVAAVFGKADTLKAILSAVDDKEALVRATDKKRATTLMAAVSHDRADIANTLLNVVQDKENFIRLRNAVGSTALAIATMKGHTDTVKLMLNSVNDKDSLIRISGQSGHNALACAAINNHIGTVKVILDAAKDKKALMMEQGESGLSALSGAVRNGHTDIAIALLNAADDKDALIRTQDKNGNHLLLLAALGGHTDLIAALLKMAKHKDELINATNHHGYGVFTVAAHNRNGEIVRVLLNTYNE